jgi:hypothetical protein
MQSADSGRAERLDLGGEVRALPREVGQLKQISIWNLSPSCCIFVSARTSVAASFEARTKVSGRYFTLAPDQKFESLERLV